MSTLTVGTISEKVVDAGVSIDSLTIKDGALSLAVAQKANTFTGTLASVSGVLNFDTYNNFLITLASGSNSLDNPSTEAGNVGQTGFIIFIQPSSSSAGTVSLGTDYETAGAGGASSLTLSSTNNQYDVVPYIIKADNSILLGTPQLNFG
jgi:hypothetical protein